MVRLLGVGRSWSESVGTPEWLSAAQEWIHDALANHQLRITGRIEQPRIRPWSTQLIVPTNDGHVWFKANCQPNRFEARLQQVLARLAHGTVATPLAIDPSRGWMLTRDHGSSLDDQHEPTLTDWQNIVSHSAQMQRRLADEAPVVLDTGLPNYSPPTVVERFVGLIERFSSLPPEHPSYLDQERVVRLELAQDRVEDAATRLAEAPIPATFVHGDLHPGNVFIERGQLKLFDFGDAQWAFALEDLVVPYGWIANKHMIEWEPVHDAYRQHWSDLVTDREFDALWGAAEIVQAVNRSATWWRALHGASAEEWVQWGGGPASHLRNVLEVPMNPRHR